MGDLSENAEYHMAKQRQEFVRARLGMMKKRMAELSLMNLANIPRDKAALGSTIVVFDSTKDEEIVYKLVTSEETDVTKGLISTTSPIGRALMGKKVGDVAIVVTPDGKRELEVLKLTTIHDEADAARRAETRQAMTWTSAFGKGCGWLLYKIVDGLALTRISPNALTFIGLLINVAAALLFGYASADNHGAHVRLRRPGHYRRRHLRHGRRPRRPRHQPGHRLRRLLRLRHRPLLRRRASSSACSSTTRAPTASSTW